MKKFEGVPTSETGPVDKEAESVAEVDGEASQLDGRLREIRAYIEASQEQKEQKEKGELSIVIDHDFIESRMEQAQTPQERALWETFSRLPEQLVFEPGITAIVGENASGKSTLAKAIMLAVQIRYQTEHIKSHRTESYIDRTERLNPSLVEKYKKEAVETFDNAESTACEEVLHPNNRGEAAFIASAGLATELCQAIRIESLYSNMGKVYYTDVPAIIGTMRHKDLYNLEEDTWVSMNDIASARTIPGAPPPRASKTIQEAAEELRRLTAERGSTRQALEKELSSHIYGPFERRPGTIQFIDEPEEGISPRRHRHLEENLNALLQGADSASPDTVAVVPTNSIVFYEDPNLPRIDLEYPERGIFRPKDYPPENG